MIDVSMITMNCARAMRASAAQRRGDAVCMRFLSEPPDGGLTRLRGHGTLAARCGRTRRYLRVDVEAEHHSALVVFGDVAVRHPSAGVGDVQQQVHDLTRWYEDGVLPDEVRLRGSVAGEDEEAAGAVDVEGVVHRMV